MVLQDGSVMVPFLVLPALVAPLLHGLRGLPHRARWRLVAGGCIVGGLAVLVGLFGTEDGTLQALGVLGGATMLAAAGVAAAVLVVVAKWQAGTRRSARHAVSSGGS